MSEPIKPDRLPVECHSLPLESCRLDVQYSIRKGWSQWASDPGLLAAAVPATLGVPNVDDLRLIDNDEQYHYVRWATAGLDLSAMATAWRDGVWDAIVAVGESSSAGAGAAGMLLETALMPDDRTVILACVETARLLIEKSGRRAADTLCASLYSKMLVPAELVSLAVAHAPAVEVNHRVYPL